MRRLIWQLSCALGLLAAAPAGATDYVSAAQLSELGARWWQWAFSFPAASNPLTDGTGERCGLGQTGKVWFLGGSFSSPDPVRRECAPVPVQTSVLIPALNAECSSIEGDGATEAALRACARGLIQGATGKAWVDGIPVPVVRGESPLFLFTLPAGDVLGRGPAVSKSVAAGLWAMIPPLRTGNHTIRVEGKVGTFTQDVSYRVTIQAPAIGR